jgi:hypothetical protein
MKPVKSRIGPLGFPAVVLVLGFLVGCATTPIPGASHDLLKFLQIGQTTRQEVLLTLGQPSASFEQEKILTYRLGEDAKQGYYLIIPNATMQWQVVHYSLVLVFDSSGVLQRQNLVAVQ